MNQSDFRFCVLKMLEARDLAVILKRGKDQPKFSYELFSGRLLDLTLTLFEHC
jgi:hypothetical protein